MKLIENGDLFERDNAKWLEENLWHYEPLWSDYIGNDGENHPQPQHPIKFGCELRLQLFAQAHYTMAVSARLLSDLSSRIEKDALARIDSGIHVLSSDVFLGEVEKFFLLMAYVGNICDQLTRMGEQVTLDLSQELKDRLKIFYDGRHAVVHGPRAPVGSDGLELLVPKLGGMNEKPDEWNGKGVWCDVPISSYRPLSQFARETRSEMFATLNAVHGELRGAIKQLFNLDSWRPAPNPLRTEPQIPLVSNTVRPPQIINPSGAPTIVQVVVRVLPSGSWHS